MRTLLPRPVLVECITDGLPLGRVDRIHFSSTLIFFVDLISDVIFVRFFPRMAAPLGRVDLIHVSSTLIFFADLIFQGCRPYFRRPYFFSPTLFLSSRNGARTVFPNRILEADF